MRRCLVPLLFAIACAPEPVDEDAEDASFTDASKEDRAWLPSPELVGALRVANELDGDALVGQAKLARRAASGIVSARAGRDGALGTADDVRFESAEELDAARYVGEVALEKLVAHARVRGWIPSPLTVVASTPVDGATAVDRCAPIELTLSEPVDPESVSPASRVFAIAGDRIRLWPEEGSLHQVVSFWRLRGQSGVEMEPSFYMRFQVGAAAAPRITARFPEGDGVPVDTAIRVEVCGAEASAVTLRLFDGDSEIPLHARPLQRDHEYRVVATLAGVEERWSFRTTRFGRRREAVAMEHARVDVAADGTILLARSGGSFLVRAASGAWSPGQLPATSDLVRALPGGRVRALWSETGGVIEGVWTEGVWQKVQITDGAPVAIGDDDTIVVVAGGQLRLGTREAGAWSVETVDTGIGRLDWAAVTRTADGQPWVSWRESDQLHDSRIATRTRTGWVRRAPYDPIGLKLVVDGGGGARILRDSEIDGPSTWVIDASGQMGPERQLGSRPSDARSLLVSDRRGNVLAVWASGPGTWARWYREDLGTWATRASVGSGRPVGAATVDGTVYLLTTEAVYRGRADGDWEMVTRISGDGIGVSGGVPFVHDRLGLWWLTE